jgi:hypothetical protein
MTMPLHGWSALLAAVLVASVTGIPRAQSPHGVGTVTARLVETGVHLCWHETGLRKHQRVGYLATATATATYVCVTHAHQCSSAASALTVSGPVTATRSFTAGRNGQVTACLALAPPSPGAFTCPDGQTRTLAHAQFADIAVTNTTNDETRSALPVSLGATRLVCAGD